MNNAKLVLIVASKIRADESFDEGNAWHNFLRNIRTHMPPLEGVESLAENVWQIDLTNGLKGLSEILREAIAWKVPIRVLFFEEAPVWLKYPPDAESSQRRYDEYSHAP